MADKVKLTLPMTDSKTPDYVRTTFGPKFFEDVGMDAGKWVSGLRVRLGTDAPCDGVLRDFFDAALLSAYERGRKEGVEDAARFLQENHTIIAGEPADPLMPSLVEAIRQLLEVKG